MPPRLTVGRTPGGMFAQPSNFGLPMRPQMGRAPIPPLPSWYPYSHVPRHVNPWRFQSRLARQNPTFAAMFTQQQLNALRGDRHVLLPSLPVMSFIRQDAQVKTPPTMFGPVNL